MTFTEYQNNASKTAIYKQSLRILYPALKISGEAGEVSEKVGKSLRDDISWESNDFKKDIALELGDVLWYIAAICRDLGISMDAVAQMNLDKLSDRKERGVLQGNGDNR